MQYTVINSPDVEPISLNEAKGYLKVDFDTDNNLILMLIEAARRYTETLLGQALITQTIEAVYDCWEPIVLPLSNAQSVTSVKYYDVDGLLQTLSSDRYLVNLKGKPNTIRRHPDYSWPELQVNREAPIEVVYVAGFGDSRDAIPSELKMPIYKVLGEFYEKREDKPWEKVTASKYLIRKNAVWTF